ncbi:transposon Ty3-I Gag-Pol polyprotein [Trichonephila clavipes]|nr:transposon Ty3-I Gag-Pol polyprotein [Trichonephila clavipes]
MLPFCPNDFDDNNITKIAARAEESRQLARVHTLRAQDKDRRRYDSKHQMVSYAPGDLVWVYTPVLRRLSAVTYEVQDFDPVREVVHVLRMKPYHDPAEQIETEDIPPKESYKGPITRSRIKTLEQNDFVFFSGGSNATRIICYNRKEKEKSRQGETYRRRSRWNEAGVSFNTDPSSDERQMRLNIVKCSN